MANRRPPPDPRRIEVVDPDMAEILRAKTGAERFQIACRMFDDARRMLTHHLGAEHPDWDEEQVQREVARRISYGNL